MILKALAGYLLIINVITFVMYGIDKSKAKHDKWRIPENTLICLAVVGGSIGALFGMIIFHHKTKKLKFFVGVPVILVLQIALAGFCCYHFGLIKTAPAEEISLMRPDCPRKRWVRRGRKFPGILVPEIAMEADHASLFRSDRGKNGMIYTELT